MIDLKPLPKNIADLGRAAIRARLKALAQQRRLTLRSKRRVRATPA
jgi:hypothetical protein